MSEALEICGTKSGRDIDKFKKFSYTALQGKTIDTPYIQECPVHFECKIIYKDDIAPGVLPKELEDDVYPNKNMHMLYYGEITGTYAVEEADKKLIK
jgi:flavin reductase (DIM6/NTAB) family NADH-FMN oxidoreductase RutF